VLDPLERLFAIESASGILLVVAAAIALGWANSPWAASYTALWHTPIGFRIGPLELEHDLHFWINDGLMAIFFFVIGLEIRREIHAGELSSVRRAALPLVAALGGMLVPALIYASLNAGQPTLHGWGIPMATDIAFAVGVLTLLGPRVPPALRVLLLAVAVIDDVGAILVIALFYSSGIALGGCAIAAGGIALLLVMQKIGVRSPWLYVAPAAVVWHGVYAAGIHPTIAGVAVGLLTPVQPWYGAEAFASNARNAIDAVLRARSPDEQLHYLDQIQHARMEAASPVGHMIHRLHPWVAFGIMPLFALANSGVPLGSAEFSGDGAPVLGGILGGLVVGKLVGLLSCSWLAVRLGFAQLPTGVGWRAVIVVGLVAGIGFTMALFIAALALPAGPMLETAKLAILCASLVAATLTLVVGRMLLPARDAVT
jgi:NhaA family Na+:H+ antiporter